MKGLGVRVKGWGNSSHQADMTHAIQRRLNYWVFLFNTLKTCTSKFLTGGCSRALCGVTPLDLNICPSFHSDDLCSKTVIHNSLF